MTSGFVCATFLVSFPSVLTHSPPFLLPSLLPLFLRDSVPIPAAQPGRGSTSGGEDEEQGHHPTASSAVGPGQPGHAGVGCLLPKEAQHLCREQGRDGTWLVGWLV